MMKAVPRLRERKDMHTHLVLVSKDTYLETKLYPLLLEKAGEHRVPRGVAVTIALAIHEFGNRLPQNVPNSAIGLGDKLIDAIMADPKVAGEAKAYLKEMIVVSTKNKATSK